MKINTLENIALQHSHTPITDKHFRQKIWQFIGDNILNLLHSFSNTVPIDTNYGIQPPYLPITDQSILLIEKQIISYEKRLKLSSIKFNKVDGYNYLVIKGKSQYKDNIFPCEYIFKVKYKFGLVCFSLKENR